MKVPLITDDSRQYIILRICNVVNNYNYFIQSKIADDEDNSKMVVDKEDETRTKEVHFLIHYCFSVILLCIVGFIVM